MLELYSVGAGQYNVTLARRSENLFNISGQGIILGKIEKHKDDALDIIKANGRKQYFRLRKSIPGLRRNLGGH